MAIFHKTPPQTFYPMYINSVPYNDFHFAIIKEFNKPKRKRVISWFVLNYQGRRIVSVSTNDGKPYFVKQRFFSCGF